LENKKGWNKKSHPKAKETRERILDAAIRLFSKRGYRGASVADIAKEAGVAKSAVFWHFESKDGLLNTLTKRMVGGGVQRLVSEVISAGATDEADLLDTLLNHYQKSLETEPDLHRAYFILSAETAATDEKASKPFIEAFLTFPRFLKILIQNGQEKGIFSKEWSPDEMSWLMAILVAGANTYFNRVPEIEAEKFYSIIRHLLKELLIVDTDKWQLSVEAAETK